jgi:hypothetical protein
MDDSPEAIDAETAPSPTYAFVEIFGHRQHYAEIRDVALAGGKLLEVRDIDTEKVHLYGAAAIFSLTIMSVSEVESHRSDMKRRREAAEKWESVREHRALAHLVEDEGDPLDSDTDEDCPL